MYVTFCSSAAACQGLQGSGSNISLPSSCAAHSADPLQPVRALGDGLTSARLMLSGLRLTATYWQSAAHTPAHSCSSMSRQSYFIPSNSTALFSSLADRLSLRLQSAHAVLQMLPALSQTDMLKARKDKAEGALLAAVAVTHL